MGRVVTVFMCLLVVVSFGFSAVPVHAASYPGKIVYEASRVNGDQSNSPIYIMNPDTSERVLIGNGSSPVFSPDGTRVAFYVQLPSTTQDFGYPRTVIRSVNIDGSDPQDLFNGSAGAATTLVRWSPSGRFIAVNETQNGPGSIGFVDTAAGTKTPFKEYLQGGLSLVFDWTPDGQNALWQASTEYFRSKNLFYGDPDQNGRGAVQLTNGQFRTPFNPRADHRVIGPVEGG